METSAQISINFFKGILITWFTFPGASENICKIINGEELQYKDYFITTVFTVRDSNFYFTGTWT